MTVLFQLQTQPVLASNQLEALFHVFIYFIYMFRASQCSSSGDRIVLIPRLVWLVCVSDCLVCRYPLHRGFDWTSVTIWTVWRRECLCLCGESNCYSFVYS